MATTTASTSNNHHTMRRGMDPPGETSLSHLNFDDEAELAPPRNKDDYSREARSSIYSQEQQQPRRSEVGNDPSVVLPPTNTSTGMNGASPHPHGHVPNLETASMPSVKEPSMLAAPASMLAHQHHRASLQSYYSHNQDVPMPKSMPNYNHHFQNAQQQQQQQQYKNIRNFQTENVECGEISGISMDLEIMNQNNNQEEEEAAMRETKEIDFQPSSTERAAAPISIELSDDEDEYQELQPEKERVPSILGGPPSSSQNETMDVPTDHEPQRKQRDPLEVDDEEEEEQVYSGVTTRGTDYDEDDDSDYEQEVRDSVLEVPAAPTGLLWGQSMIDLKTRSMHETGDTLHVQAHADDDDYVEGEDSFRGSSGHESQRNGTGMQDQGDNNQGGEEEDDDWSAEGPIVVHMPDNVFAKQSAKSKPKNDSEMDHSSSARNTTNSSDPPSEADKDAPTGHDEDYPAAGDQPSLRSNEAPLEAPEYRSVQPAAAAVVASAYTNNHDYDYGEDDDEMMRAKMEAISFGSGSHSQSNRSHLVSEASAMTNPTSNGRNSYSRTNDMYEKRGSDPEEDRAMPLPAKKAAEPPSNTMKKKQSKYNEISVDGSVLDVDAFIERNEDIVMPMPQDHHQPSQYDEELITREVGTDDSMINTSFRHNPYRILEQQKRWRNHAREDKGISVLEAPITADVNVDSVIRMQNDDTNPYNPYRLKDARSESARIESILELDPSHERHGIVPKNKKAPAKKPSPAGANSKATSMKNNQVRKSQKKRDISVDQEVNVDSVIRMNHQYKHQQAIQPQSKWMNEVNVDSIIRLNQTNPGALPPRPVKHPSAYGIEEVVNVDSFIASNSHTPPAPHMPPQIPVRQATQPLEYSLSQREGHDNVQQQQYHANNFADASFDSTNSSHRMQDDPYAARPNYANQPQQPDYYSAPPQPYADYDPNDDPLVDPDLAAWKAKLRTGGDDGKKKKGLFKKMFGKKK